MKLKLKHKIITSRKNPVEDWEEKTGVSDLPSGRMKHGRNIDDVYNENAQLDWDSQQNGQGAAELWPLRGPEKEELTLKTEE
ncbi:hypothetical protein C0J52_28079 [Blattella germanica]|nr:hypothetical protein C0J52_28079 [Blattella germanica]